LVQIPELQQIPGVPTGLQIPGVRMFWEEKPPKDIDRITTIDAGVKGGIL